MAKAVLIQNPDSIYKDEPGVRYHFPKMYRATLEACIDDWVVFYEGKKGMLGYTGVQKVLAVRPDPDMDDHYFADLALGTLWEFERPVPRNNSQGSPFESMLRRPDGSPLKGGANTLAVRRLPEADFAAIIDVGLAPLEGAEALPRVPEARPAELPGMAEAGASFDFEAPLAGTRDMLLSSRPARDASFARMVKSAYGGQCAISGLMLRNGGGRPEVEAAHIRPVAHGGPDSIRNGIALSGTLHWMFDRGLISVADDYRILVAHNKVDRETVDRLIVPGGKLRLPRDPRHHPHPAYLRYHREEIYGGLG